MHCTAVEEAACSVTRKRTAQCAHCAVQEEAGNANGVVTVGQSQGSTASQCKPLHTQHFTVHSATHSRLNTPQCIELHCMDFASCLS